MMKSIISIFSMIVFVVAGIFGADFLKTYQIQNQTYPDFITWVKPASPKPDSPGGLNSEKDGARQPVDELGGNFYLNFKKQFVVPIISASKVDALVVVSLAVEVDREHEELVTAIEPKLRDALTRALLGLANEGTFSGNITQADNLKKIQKRLARAAKSIIGKPMKNVLILDVVRQDR